MNDTTKAKALANAATANLAPGKWREDFPVDWEHDNLITRREFTKFLIAVSGVAAAGTGLITLRTARPRIESFPRVEIGAEADVSVGGVKLFRYPTEKNPAILIRLGASEYVAYLQACTHLSCPVTYSQKSGRIECPCHHGVFAAESGEVISGPPPRALPKICLAREGGRLFAEGIEDV
jgi:Rieske Fe-S protein